MPEDQVLQGEEPIPSEEYFPPQDGVSVDPYSVPASFFLSY